MNTAATIIGIMLLIWIFVGPLVGYAVALRGWRIRSPFHRAEDEDETL